MTKGLYLRLKVVLYACVALMMFGFWLSRSGHVCIGALLMDTFLFIGVPLGFFLFFGSLFDWFRR